MRRWVSGMRACGVGVVSGSGWVRSVLWVIVGDEGDDGVGFEFFAAVQVGEFYDEGYACYRAAGVFDELAHGAGGASRGEQVVCYEDAGTLGDRVCVGFQGIGAVFEVVGGGDD